MTFLTRLKNYLILLLFTGYLLALPCSVFATEQAGSRTDTIAVPRQQLMLLQTKLNQLESICEQSEAHSIRLKRELAQCQVELKKAKLESETLKMQLSELKQQSQNSEELLASANKSLMDYSKEMKSKLATAKTQRDIAWITAIGILVVSVKN